MPAWLSAVLVIAGCAVLTWAGLEKARDRRPLAATIVALGLPPGLAAAGATLVPVAELATVLAVVAGAPPVVTFALFAALGTGFAAAAVRSLASGAPVACACFGSSGTALGWRQLAALPLWLVAGWATTALPVAGPADRLAIFASGMLVLVAARAVPAIRRGIAARGDRRAMAGV
jgi:methylamine utilization protein MauE